MQVVHARTTRPLNGLIWPKAGFASIVWPQRGEQKFLPLGVPPIPRGTRNFCSPRPPLRSGRKCGASPIASGLQIAIEAAVVAGSNNSKEQHHG
jgi:hypothetical protein